MRLALGVATHLISHVTGEFAPEALTSWTVDCLPRPARLWVETYGHRAVLENYPGSKLYLLLQSALQEQYSPLDRPVWRFIVPLRLPPPSIRALPNETLSRRLSRYRMRIGFLLGRVRFCTVEGLRFMWESRRWQRLLARVQA